MKRKIIIAGGSGFVGKKLTNYLTEQNFAISILTRNPDKQVEKSVTGVKYIKYDLKSVGSWQHHLEGAEAVINLAGDNLSSGLWTAEKKRNIRESRIKTATLIRNLINNLEKKPAVFIQASAVGYYGSRADKILTESNSAGDGFLANVVNDWEAATEGVETRRIILRFGVVLSSESIFFKLTKIPFYFLLGGHPGSGRQWISWIHHSDLVKAVHFLIEAKNAEGIYNVSAPHPVTAREYFQRIGEFTNRPSWFHQPAFLLRLLPGRMADEMLLTSQKVIPKKLIEAGFQFTYPGIEACFSDLFRKK